MYNARLTGETANTLNANTCLSANHAGPAVCQPTAFHLLQDPISGEVSPCLSGREQCSVGVVLDDQGGQQISVCEDGVSPTLRAQMHGHPPVVCGEANARLFEPASMKEENWQEREAKNALRSGESKVGHVVVESAVPDAVYPIEGNGQRASHQGDGWSEEQVGYTLNSVERHGVAYAIDGNVCDRVSAKNGCGYSKDVSPTLNTQDRHAVAYDIGEARLRNPSEYDEESPTITARCGSGGNNVPAVVYDARGNGDGETVQTLTGDHARTVNDYTPLVCSVDGRNCTMNEEISGTLQAKPTGGQSLNCVNPVCIERKHYAEKSYGEYSEGEGTLKASGGSVGNGSETLVCEPASVYWDGGQVANTLTKKGVDQRMPDKGQFQCVLQPKHRKYIVRRLTPLECSRLQGMPDDWCDIKPMTVKAANSGWAKTLLDKLLKTIFKKADYEAEIATKSAVDWWRPILDEWAKINGKKPKSDAQIVKWLSSPVSESAQYQMYGNGIALPQWVWVCGRIIETYGEHTPTMASLFDGTGSFPLIWNSILGGAYTAWSSEVNPDAIRVSKYRMEERGW